VHVHPIEAESYALLRARLDVTDLPPLSRAVVERVVHGTADPSWAGELVLDETALRAGRAALLAGAPLVTDARMVAAGITSRSSAVALDHAGLADEPAGGTRTRSAEGIRRLVAEHPDGAVWVIGTAPTALAELVALRPVTALVVGVPVGFVGAVEAKAALRASGLPSVSNRSERGGAAIAAAVVNALLYAEVPG
jgi:precorrin-8X/cobalt-precorrin-8 methylmutase